MAPNAAAIAGVSVTAAVAVVSIVKGRRRPSKKKNHSVKRVQAASESDFVAPLVPPPRPSASQETPFVTGNVILAINL
ncbi:hypothetical protein BWQ96_00582 [Gracilariopsis chorda]|uniref:Uncharacterized protein n=1 Tax=Gracilariopsis chorda TaxID=448386 RepID=A0A2V3J5W1_9FLOR|nr:hypothetical protein BWQ96_00582 [Gracilariopsis chorda]|eukprot:PXF49512.1 hypothetical protein BWQ96_00582 [Gracilariopsis chorda]